MDWTGAQLRTARDELQTRAEMLLGRMLFEYVRLESALDLCLVWVDEGKTLAERTKKIERISFFDKLELLEVDVRSRAAEKGSAAYMDWLTRSHSVRDCRNTCVHGRLGFNVQRGTLVAVTSRPTSTTQASVEYSLTDLESMVSEMGRLSDELSKLRSIHPL